MVYIHFYTAEEVYAGRFFIRFYSPPKYYFVWCKESYSDFSTTLPSDVNKMWQLTKHPGMRFTIQCNGVTVADLIMSDETCSYASWKKYWTRDAKLISFSSPDSASDEYRPAPGD